MGCFSRTLFGENMESCRAEQRDSLWFKVRQCYFTNLRIFQRALAGWPSYVALLFVVAMLNFGPSLAYNMSSALGTPFHKGKYDRISRKVDVSRGPLDESRVLLLRRPSYRRDIWVV